MNELDPTNKMLLDKSLLGKMEETHSSRVIEYFKLIVRVDDFRRLFCQRRGC